MKLIIAISKSLTLHGHTVRKFRYMSVHKAHVWEGRELSVEEFNKVSKAVFHENAGLYPFALAVDEGEVAVAAPVPAPAPVVVEPVAPVVPVIDPEKVKLQQRIADLEAQHKALAEEYGELLVALNPPAPVAAPVAIAQPRGKAKADKGGKV